MEKEARKERKLLSKEGKEILLIKRSVPCYSNLHDGVF